MLLVRHKGKVIYHLKDNEQLSLTNVKFVVQPAGRAKVLREKRKNVHAFVRGEFEKFKSSLEEDVYFKPFDNLDFSTASYNPYKADTFQVEMDGEMRKIAWSPQVLVRGGKVYLDFYYVLSSTG
jgi:hypothetical protein